MDIDPHDSRTWLSGVIAILLSVCTWIWLRLVGQQDRHEARLQEIEKHMAKQGDIAFLAQQIQKVGDRSNDQNNQILRMLAERK